MKSGFSNASSDLATTGYGVDIVESNLRYLSSSHISPQQQLSSLVESNSQFLQVHQLQENNQDDALSTPKLRSNAMSKLKKKTRMKGTEKTQSVGVSVQNRLNSNVYARRSRTNTASTDSISKDATIRGEWKSEKSETPNPASPSTRHLVRNLPPPGRLPMASSTPISRIRSGTAPSNANARSKLPLNNSLGNAPKPPPRAPVRPPPSPIPPRFAGKQTM